MNRKTILSSIYRFFLRSLLGFGSIYLINTMLLNSGVFATVGFNFITFLTTGLLGIPGVVALYGITIYQIL